MKEIELEVTVKYTVRTTAFVPDDVAESLNHMEEHYGFGYDPTDNDKKCIPASEWLADHIDESDALEWEYEVQIFNETDC